MTSLSRRVKNDQPFYLSQSLSFIKSWIYKRQCCVSCLIRGDMVPLLDRNFRWLLKSLGSILCSVYMIVAETQAKSFFHIMHGLTHTVVFNFWALQISFRLLLNGRGINGGVYTRHFLFKLQLRLFGNIYLNDLLDMRIKFTWVRLEENSLKFHQAVY